MPTLTQTGFPNLQDWAKRHDPDGAISDIINVLSNKKPELMDIPWTEGNKEDGHLITNAQSLPSMTWRKFNSGVTRTKAETAQFIETCGMLEDFSEVDVDLANLNGDAAAYRASEDKLKQEAFAQQFATALWYESVSSNPERIHGLTPRMPSTSSGVASAYTKVSSTTANVGSNCHSIWLVTWAPKKVYGIFPKGTQAGLMMEDLGKQRIEDSSSNPYLVWSTRYQWKCGIAVEDYRYMVRFQWDPDSTEFADDDKALYLYMQEMLTDIFEVESSTRFYMNRTSKKKLDSQLAANDANFLHYVDDGGKQVPTFMGVPIRVTDSLVAETAIT